MTILTAPVSAAETTFVVSDDSLLSENDLPQMLQIASEKFAIVGYEAASNGNTRWYVERGVDGSIAASHSGGVAITVVTAGGGGGGVSVTDGTTTVAATSLAVPAGTLSDLGGGAAAVGLLLRKVGPFTVHYNTANLVSPANPETGAVLYQVPNGVDVLKAWAVFATKWNSGTSAQLILQISDDQFNAGNLAAYDAKNAAAWGDPLGATNYAIEDAFQTASSIAVSPAINLTGDPQSFATVNTLQGPLSSYVATSITGNVYLTAQIIETGAAATAGEAFIYAYIATPAS